MSHEISNFKNYKNSMSVTRSVRKNTANIEEEKGQRYWLTNNNFYQQQTETTGFSKTNIGQINIIDVSKKYTVVWTHWLKNLCKKGENWEYLHAHIPSRMPIWKYYLIGSCTNEKCQYLHLNSRVKQNECPYYEKGFWK